MFFVHSISLFLILSKMNALISEDDRTPGRGIYFIIAMAFTTIIYSIVLGIIWIEKQMDIKYKSIVLFLAYGNCLLEFYFNSTLQFQLFERPDRFDHLAIFFILLYFIFELFLTYYIVNNKMYKSDE